jgi:GNAT superfamily N-acetyltransferase
MLGVVWLYSDSAHETGEYAILLRSDLKGRGLGWALMQLIIEYAKSEGLKQISGQILQENSVMLKMCRELGFKIKTNSEDGGVCDVTLALERRVISERWTSPPLRPSLSFRYTQVSLGSIAVSFMGERLGEAIKTALERSGRSSH